MVTKLLHGETTGRVIGVYYTVFNRLSQTYPEYIFERAMMKLLEREGVHCIRQDEYEIWYKQWMVGKQRLDLFVANAVVVELKVAESITGLHLAQLLSYMKTVETEVGLLMRFGGPQPAYERRVLTTRSWEESIKPSVMKKPAAENLLHPELVFEIIGGMLEVFRVLGPGFIHRIYANACFHELRLRGLAVTPRRAFEVFLDDINLGAIKFGHLQVDNRVLVFPVAISNVEKLNLQNLKAWMRHLNVPLGIVVNFNTTWLEPIILRV